jgi:hypothetical protein
MAKPNTPPRIMPSVATTSAAPVSDVQTLIADVFSKLQATGTLAQNSIDLDISVGDSPGRSCRVALKVTGGVAGAPAVASLAPIADLGAVPEFNAEGHHVIALVMQKDLAANSPATLAKVNQMLGAVDRDLLEAATFPDDIRNKQPQTKPFHFIDIPFENDGPVNPDLPEAPHVLSKMKEFSESLQANKGNAQSKADALSWLIHLFGDVHQPLHCIDHMSPLHPEGDRGGNLFKIKSAKRNLHSLWDSSVNVTQSLDEDEIADEIIQAHPRSSLQQALSVTDPEKWARASFKLAKTHVYTLDEDPENPPQPSMAYKKNMEKIGQKQAALAGYRLAERLQAIL